MQIHQTSGITFDFTCIEKFPGEFHAEIDVGRAATPFPCLLMLLQLLAIRQMFAMCRITATQRYIASCTCRCDCVHRSSTWYCVCKCRLPGTCVTSEKKKFELESSHESVSERAEIIVVNEMTHIYIVKLRYSKMVNYVHAKFGLVPVSPPTTSTATQ